MNKIVSFIRIAILFTLGCLSMLLIFSEEQDENLTLFCLHVIFDKAIGIGLGYVLYRLYNRWSKTDTWLNAYGKMCGEDLDKTNPSQL